MRRPRADREEKRVIHGRDINAKRHCNALRNGSQNHAERPQTRRRTRPQQCRASSSLSCPPLVPTHAGRHPSAPNRSTQPPQRWRDAVIELLALQAEYADWLTALPDSLRDSTTADALEAVVDLDLTTLADIELPRGFGRD